MNKTKFKTNPNLLPINNSTLQISAIFTKKTSLVKPLLKSIRLYSTVNDDSTLTMVNHLIYIPVDETTNTKITHCVAGGTNLSTSEFLSYKLNSLLDFELNTRIIINYTCSLSDCEYIHIYFSIAVKRLSVQEDMFYLIRMLTTEKLLDKNIVFYETDGNFEIKVIAIDKNINEDF